MVGGAVTPRGNQKEVVEEYHAAGRRYMAYYRALCTNREGVDEGKSQAGYELIDKELPNLQRAIQQAIAQSKTDDMDSFCLHTTVDMALGLSHYLGLRGYWRERQMYLEAALSACKKLNDEVTCAVTLHELGWVALDMGDKQAAQQFYEESIALKTKIGDEVGVAGTASALGSLAYERGDYDEARQYLEWALGVFRRLDRQDQIANALRGLGRTARAVGELEEAKVFFKESIAVQRQVDVIGSAPALQELGWLIHKQGDYCTAEQLYTQSLVLFEKQGDKKAWL
jgi:tetratricopeptide (TPR) repeat protein